MNATRNHGGLTFRQHTRDRWAERTGEDDPVPIERAWDRAIRVENPIPWASEARLYAPYGLLLARTGDESATVFHVDYDRLDTAGLVECDGCGLLTDPCSSDHECRWCGEGLAGVRADGRLTIRRAGGR